MSILNDFYTCLSSVRPAKARRTWANMGSFLGRKHYGGIRTALKSRHDRRGNWMVIGQFGGRVWSAVVTYRDERDPDHLGRPSRRRWWLSMKTGNSMSASTPARTWRPRWMARSRRPGEHRRVNVDFPAWMIAELDREATRVWGHANRSSRSGSRRGSTRAIRRPSPSDNPAESTHNRRTINESHHARGSDRRRSADRLSIDDQPFYSEGRCAATMGVRFNGVEKNNVHEYDVAEGWVRVEVPTAKDRRGNPMVIKLTGTVEPYFRQRNSGSVCSAVLGVRQIGPRRS